MQNKERRRVMKMLVALGAGSALPISVNSSAIRFPDYPFKLGVASGLLSSDGFVLWTRLICPALPVGMGLNVHWEVFDVNFPAKILRRGKSLAVAELGYSVHVEVHGLPADRWYGYRFMIAGANSPIGRARTLPEAGAHSSRFRFALASCQRWEDGYYGAYRHMVEEGVDAVVFVGDYIYEYKGRAPEKSVRTHNLPAAHSLQNYRDHYALYKSDPHLQRMHALCPWIVTWDDHEVENDYGGGVSGEALNPQAFVARRMAAYQAYYEHMPLPLSALTNGIAGVRSDGTLRLYRSLDVGKLATFHVLDSRQYRDVPLCGSNSDQKVKAVCGKNMLEEDRSMLGGEQEVWVEKNLTRAAKRDSRWNIIVQQTQFSPRNFSAGNGSKFSRGLWDGYSGSRSRMIDSLIRSAARNPIFVGGDIHQNWVADVHQSPYDASSPVIASEICGTSITSTSSTPQAYVEKLKAASPHCHFANSERRGYAVIEMDHEKLAVSLKGIDDPADVDSGARPLGTFVVKAGKPGFQAV